MKLLMVMIICMAVMILITVPGSSTLASEVVPVPFEISGYVFFENGSPAHNPDVTITNLNNGKTFSTETTGNYYIAKPVPLSEDINENDVLRFRATEGEKSAVAEYRITTSDMVYHRLHLNITLGEGEEEAGRETTDAGTTGGEGKQTPSPSVTPALTPSQEASPSPPTPAATPTGGAISTPTPDTTLPAEEERKKIPGFEAVFAAAVAMAYLMRNRHVGGMK